MQFDPYEEYLTATIPGTISLLKRIDAELSQFGIEIVGVRVSDTKYEHLCLDIKPHISIEVSDKSLLLYQFAKTDSDDNPIPHESSIHCLSYLDIERGIHNMIRSTCSCCGTSITTFYRGGGCEDLAELYVLCDYCESIKGEIWDGKTKALLQSNFFKQCRLANQPVSHKPSKVRFLNPEGQFDYSFTDKISELDNELYLLTQRPGYSSFDLKVELGDKAQLLFPNLLDINEHFIIKIQYAGIDTTFRDITGERIYTGDLLLNKEHMYMCFGVAICDPRDSHGCAVYHGPDVFPTLFDSIKEWSIVGNIIENNPSYSGNTMKDFNRYYQDHQDMISSLLSR